MTSPSDIQSMESITKSRLYLIVAYYRRNSEVNEAFAQMETTLPNSSAVLGLHWGNAGIFVASKDSLQLFKTQGADEEVKQEPSAKFQDDGSYNVMDVCSMGQNYLYGACDDCKLRVWDVNTQSLLTSVEHHSSIVEVICAR